MPKAQNGCEKQFRTELKKYSPALIKLNFIKAGFVPSDQLQWMIQGFSRCKLNIICKGKRYFWRGFGKSPFIDFRLLLLRRVLYRLAVSRMHMSISSNRLLCLNCNLIPLLEANSFSSFTVGFCCFAENSISMNSATLYLSVSFSEDTGLCNEEGIWLLKQSTIWELYEFLIIIIKKSIEPSQCKL